LLRGNWPGDRPMAGDGQAPRSGGPARARIADADPRARDDRGGRLAVPRWLEAERRVRGEEIEARHRSVDVEDGADETRARAEAKIGHEALRGNDGRPPPRGCPGRTTFPHQVQPGQRFDRPDEQ